MNQNDEKLNYDQIISLLSIYENEWEHRNNMLWSQIFKFFYFSIFAMILPNITEYLSISLPSIKMFPFIGLICSSLSFFMSLSYSKRLETSSKTYNNINNMLPIQYRRVKLKDLKNGNFFTKRHTITTPITL